jgi:MFS family permease
MSSEQPNESTAPGQSGLTASPPGDAGPAMILSRWQLLLAYAAGPFAFSFGGMMRFLVPIRASELDAPLVIIGLIVSAGALVPALTSIPSGALADRIGARWAYVLGTYTSALVAFAFAFVRSYWGMLALQLVLGLFRSVAWVAAQTYITGVGAPSERVTLTSRFSFATNAGTMVSPLAIGVVAQVMGFRISFLFLVLVALLFTAIGLALPNVRQAPATHREAPSGAGFGAALALLRLRGIQTTMLFTFVRLWIGTGWTAFYPLFLINRGTPPALVGTILSSHSAVATVTALGAGRLSRRFGKEVVMAVSLGL